MRKDTFKDFKKGYKTMKHNKQFTVNVDDDTAAIIYKLAEIYQRKPAELLRLLIAPAIEAAFLQIQAARPENQTQPTPAHFVRDPFMKI